MLDRIPWQVKFEYWARRNSDALLAWAFPLVALACAGAYYPIRSMMIDQETRVSVIASTLTVTYILCLFFIGYGSGKLIERYIGHRKILRWVTFGGVLVVLFLFLDFVGYDVKW